MFENLKSGVFIQKNTVIFSSHKTWFQLHRI